jgi:hypothetical protein
VTRCVPDRRVGNTVRVSSEAPVSLWSHLAGQACRPTAAVKTPKCLPGLFHGVNVRGKEICPICGLHGQASGDDQHGSTLCRVSAIFQRTHAASRIAGLVTRGWGSRACPNMTERQLREVDLSPCLGSMPGSVDVGALEPP